ncbi:hypothetical protein PENTCL1PPCAC_10398, partial [Pristionchus entomophagus]
MVGSRAALVGHAHVLLVVLEHLLRVETVDLLEGQNRRAGVVHLEHEKLLSSLSGRHSEDLLQFQVLVLVFLARGRLHRLAALLLFLSTLLSLAFKLHDELGTRRVVLILPRGLVERETLPLQKVLHLAVLVHPLVEDLLHGVLLAIVVVALVLLLLAALLAHD